MKAIGITCGIGSMLVGAKKAGFDVVGNIEWRRYYHVKDGNGKNTFLENFPGAIFAKTLDDLSPEQREIMTNADIAFGHPECGNYSNLTATAPSSKSLSEFNSDPGDIPIFAGIVAALKPRFFVQDNLPKSLLGFSIQQWVDALPDYDLFPEWVSNWGYGNIQKYRNRFFMIGALKSERFSFVPGEHQQSITLRKILQNLPSINQDPHTLVGTTYRGKGNYSEKAMNWAQYQEYMQNQPDGWTIGYYAEDGTWKKHVGCRKGFKDDYCPVITGGVPIANPFTCLPFTLRERCRIQGLPDDFIIYGLRKFEDGTFSHVLNGNVNRQVGKCMPVQFCEYVAKQIITHITSDFGFMGKPTRILQENPLVTEAKLWYCENIGYTNQREACQNCWKKGKCQ